MTVQTELVNYLRGLETAVQAEHSAYCHTGLLVDKREWEHAARVYSAVLQALQLARVIKVKEGENE